MESARGTLQKLLAGILNRFPAEQVPLEAWPFVCGKQVSRRTQAVSFADGILRVEVPDAAWRAQLQDLSASYLAGLNRYSPTPVEKIEFILAAASGSEPAQQRRAPRTSGESSSDRKGNGRNKSKRK